jgi:cytochrome b561
MTSAVNRYHPLLVALHWLLALMVIANLLAGLFVLSEMPNTSAKLSTLRIHMVAGLAIGGLMVLRLLVRLFTKRPPIPHQSGPLKWLAIANHWLFYLVVLSMVSTGLGIAQFAGLFPLLGGRAVALPADFHELEPFIGHEVFSRVLIALVVLHLAGFAYHWWSKRENILPRMWFGNRRSEEPASQP